MTIPTHIVTAYTLATFARAAEEALTAEEYLIISAISLAGNGEQVQIGHLILLTGIPQPTAITLLRKLKADGYLEQLGASYLLTSRSKQTLKNIQSVAA